MMKQPREVWFVPSAVRGFGVVHWKGPMFILGVALVAVPAGLFALANEDRHPPLSVVGMVLAIGAIIVGYYVCAIHTAERDDDDSDNLPLRESHWRALPLWAKTISLGVALPAWLVLASSVFTGQWDTPFHHAAFLVFMAVALLQTALLFRSYWKTEL